MGKIQRWFRRIVKSDHDAPVALWPQARKKPRVLYEVDRQFHEAYDRALGVTSMRDVVMRRQRYYSFRYLLHGVAAVPGDVCEVGCYRGLSAHLIASTLHEMGKAVTFHLCDSFEGLSEFAPVDRSDLHDMNHPDKRQKYICSLETVRHNLQEFDFIAYHKGWIPAPFQALGERRFCFVHIDVDLYRPTRDSFEFFYPRLNPNGVMVFDDYGSVKFPGARQALDECLSRVTDAFFLAFPSGQAFLIKLAPPKETAP